jgi:hypothetical protein
MVVAVLKVATRTLIQVVLIQVRKELVVIRAVLKVVRKELVGMRVALTVVLKGLVAIRMAQAQITEALMVTWDPVGIPMGTPMVVLVKMETVTPVKKGTLMRKRRLV